MFLSNFSDRMSSGVMESTDQQIELLKTKLNQAETVLIGAGSGLSTAAGFAYSGERFRKYFGDFAKKYGIQDMYSGGFYRSRTWRHIGPGGAVTSITTGM